MYPTHTIHQSDAQIRGGDAMPVNLSNLINKDKRVKDTELRELEAHKLTNLKKELDRLRQKDRSSKAQVRTGKIDQYTQTENHLSCSICLYAFHNKSDIISLVCGHSFHKSCMDKWKMKSTSSFLRCPTCRYPVETLSCIRKNYALMEELNWKKPENVSLRMSSSVSAYRKVILNEPLDMQVEWLLLLIRQVEDPSVVRAVMQGMNELLNKISS